jgi:hypothetical protein
MKGAVGYMGAKGEVCTITHIWGTAFQYTPHLPMLPLQLRYYNLQHSASTSHSPISAPQSSALI